MTSGAWVGRSVGVVLVMFIGLVAACSDDDDAKPAPDAAGACKDMCSRIGFVSSRVDVQAKETNCFCSGAGTVTQDECAKMCTVIGKAGASPFRSGAAAGNDACQCQ